MSDTPAPAFDPETTPNGLAAEVGMDHLPTGVPVAPYPHGETFTDEEGKARHVPVPVDDKGTPTGTSVGVKVGDDETTEETT